MLKILVLGPPAILNDDKPLKIQRRQARTLLYYLACQPDGVSRGDVITRLWKESGEAESRKNLREILSKLRSELPDPDTIQSDQERLWLNPEKVYSDYIHFMDLIQPAIGYFGISQNQNSLPEKIVERLEISASIWRSPVFLAGLGIRSTSSFDDWFQAKSNSLAYFRMQSLERLADHFSSIGDQDKAIFYLTSALEGDPLDENLQQNLLDLYYKAGRFNEAKSYYQYLNELYQRELEEVPPEIIQMVANEHERGRHEPQSTSSTRYTDQKSSQHRFIGRKAELDQLENLYANSPAALVIGEVGSGKTHFVQYFCSSLEEKPRTFFLSCHEDEVKEPFQPIINLIRQYFSDEDFEKLETRWQAPLSKLIPEIGKINRQLLLSDDAPLEDSQQSLFEAIFQLLNVNKYDIRSIIVVDDIQWMDQASLELLMNLLTRDIFTKKCFLILIARIEFDNPKINLLVKNDEKNPIISRIEINSFSLEDTGIMAAQIFGRNFQHDFVQKLHRATGGNPLLIRESLIAILDSVDDRNTIVDSEIQFSENLTSIFQKKEENLEPFSWEVLSAAAVCGMDFQYEILESLNLCSPKELVRVLEVLENKQFIHSRKNFDTVGKYSFHHSFLRDSLLARLSPARQCYLHEQVALAKIKQKGLQVKRQASVIARHFELAGKPVLAFPYWIKAGQYARDLFSKEEAFAAYRKSNQICREFTQDIPESDLYELFQEWGDLAFNLMDIAVMFECFTSMYETGMQIGSDLLIGAGQNGLGFTAFYDTDFEKGLILLEESIPYLDKSGDLFEMVQGRYRLGMALSTMGQNDQAIEILKEAIRLGERSSNQKIRQAVTMILSFNTLLYSILGWPLKAVESGNSGLRNALMLLVKPNSQAAMYATMAIAEYYSGSFTKSMDHIKKSKHLTETLPNPRILSLMLILESRLNTLKGKLDIGLTLGKKALDLATENHYFESISEARCVCGDVYLTLHLYDQAIQEYTLGFKDIPVSHSTLDNQYRLGYTTAMKGDLEAGLKILESSISDSARLKLDSVTLPARYLYAQLLGTNGRLDESRILFESVIPEFEARGYSLITVPGSAPRLKYLWDNMDNHLMYQVIKTMMEDGAIKPDRTWSDRLIFHIKKNMLHHDLIDVERFRIFLNTLIEQYEGV